jgi:hypothetical protein
MFNFNDDPASLYHRMHVNLELSRELGIRVTGFPMKFIPVDDITRRYVSPKWHWRYISRVAEGGSPPPAPTDPDVRNSRIRLFVMRSSLRDAQGKRQARRWQRIPPLQEREAVPCDVRRLGAAGKPLLPETLDAEPEAVERTRVPGYPVVPEVPPKLLAQRAPLLPDRKVPVRAAPPPDCDERAAEPVRRRLALDRPGASCAGRTSGALTRPAIHHCGFYPSSE